jgi:hypothetical protein
VYLWFVVPCIFKYLWFVVPCIFKYLWFVVPCIFKYSNKTTNHMHTQLKNLLLFSRLNAAQHVSGNILPIIRSTFWTAVAASGFRIKAEVDVFPAVVCLLVGCSPLTSRPRLETQLSVHLVGCFTWILCIYSLSSQLVTRSAKYLSAYLHCHWSAHFNVYISNLRLQCSPYIALL